MVSVCAVHMILLVDAVTTVIHKFFNFLYPISLLSPLFLLSLLSLSLAPLPSLVPWNTASCTDQSTPLSLSRYMRSLQHCYADYADIALHCDLGSGYEYIALVFVPVRFVSLYCMSQEQ